MTSRVSWSVDGIEPSVREKAEAAARRAGMSLTEWMNSMARDAGPDVREAREVAEIHSRLDSITRQVEKISGPPAAGGGDGVARQLNDAISRLDARLSQISGGSNAAAATAPRGSAADYRSSPSLSPAAPDEFSIEEILNRQNELNGAPRPAAPRTPLYGASPLQMPSHTAPPVAPAYPDFSGFERQLGNISNQIETLRRPDSIEHSISEFRGELSEIRRAITDAMPRRAIESLEGEIRSIGRKIDENRHNGSDHPALPGIERALSDIRSELRSLMPAEQLAGFDDAIRNLGGKLDTIVRSSRDPGTIHQLEDSITALKAIVANVASTDAINQLAENVHRLSAKVDQIDRSSGKEFFSALEQRIAALTTTLESRDRAGSGDSSYFDNAVRAISDRLDHLQVGNDSSSNFAHVEQRVHHLLERLELAEPRDGELARVEDGLNAILQRLESSRPPSFSGRGDVSESSVPSDGLADTIKRELSDMRFTQMETDRHTQDSLEVVHSTLGHVVDRLAQIEGDLRQRPAPAAAATPVRHTDEAAKPQRAVAVQATPALRPEMPNPAASQAPVAARAAQAVSAAPHAQPLELRDVTIPNEQPRASDFQPAMSQRSPIDASLPPDHPLEPGTRLPGSSTPSERIAASQVVLNGLPAGAHEPASSTNFIQAARRAAQAAAAASAAAGAGHAPAKSKKVTASSDMAQKASQPKIAKPSKLTSRIRALLVGASVAVIALGTAKLAVNMLGVDDAKTAAPETQPAPQAKVPAVQSLAPIATVPKANTPVMIAPKPVGRQSDASPFDGAAVDVTSSIDVRPPAAEPVRVPRKPAAPFVAVNDKIPDGIAGPILRAAALKGDPAAAFEIGVRYAEGRGVPINYVEAAKWYDRAAQRDIVPATFRLGTLYEKGLGVDKNTETARRLYMQAAERGNAKAMHNLAVLDADGGSKGPNYNSAAQWFRKAADLGVADSQFNLGVLYARGIGVEQNLAESFKWFSLAAAQGDADSGRKRDEIAKRLDAQSLAAAKLAIKGFTPGRQPDDAIETGAPAGGWDNAPVQKVTTKAGAPKPAAPTKPAAAAKPTAAVTARPVAAAKPANDKSESTTATR